MVSKQEPASGRFRNILGLLVSLALCFAAAGIGSIAVSQTLQTWYTELHKPAWNPPNWVFGPVWSLLYTAMAVSAWLVWKNLGTNPGGVRVALTWFAIQLLLNIAWSYLFFAWRQPGWAFVEIIILWGAIVMSIVTSWRVNRGAGVLLVPYLLWVTFASALNGTIWRLNSW